MNFLLTYNTKLRTVTPEVIEVMYLDHITFQILFLDSNALPAGATISMEWKQQGDFTGAGVFAVGNFTLNAQTGYWESEVDIEDTPLTDLFDPNPAEVRLYTNLLVEADTEKWFQGPIQEVVISNVYTQGA